MMKTCNICKRELELTDFYRNRAQRDGYEHSCKPCKLAQNKRYEGDRTEYRKSYYKSNKEKIDARQKQRQLEDKEAYLEYRRQYRKKYMATDKGVMHNRMSSSKRRAAKASVISEKYDFLSICEAHNWACFLCGGLIDKTLRWPDKEALTIEHIKPIALGGDDVSGNVAPAHFGCNVSNAPIIRKMKAVQSV